MKEIKKLFDVNVVLFFDQKCLEAKNTTNILFSNKQRVFWFSLFSCRKLFELKFLLFQLWLCIWSKYFLFVILLLTICWHIVSLFHNINFSLHECLNKRLKTFIVELFQYIELNTIYWTFVFNFVLGYKLNEPKGL